MQFFNRPIEQLAEDWKDVLDKYDVAEEKRGLVAPLIAGVCDGREADEIMEIFEANASGDVAQYLSVVIPMISRAFPGVIGPEIFGFQPTETPSGLIFYMTRHYTNDTDNPAKPDTTVALVLADGSAFSVGDACATTGEAGTGIVRHIDSDGNTMLVGDVTGTFVVGADIDNVNPFVAAETTIAAVYTSEIAYQFVFDNYNDYATVALAEAATTNMKEIELKIDSAPIVVTDHQIKIKWTRQMEYDLKKLHGKSAEAILSNAAAQEFALSLNKKQLDLLKASAALGGNTTWDYDGADGRWEVEKYQNLLAVINRDSAKLLVNNHIGAANFLIMDPVMFASLDTMGLIDKSMLPGGMADPMINPFSGILHGRYRVYQDVFQGGSTSARYIYLGFKDFSGSPEAELKAGYFLSMYKAIDSIKLVGEENGHPRKIFESRYALTENPFGADKFYSMITATNFPG